jgi:hypothetical protein
VSRALAPLRWVAHAAAFAGLYALLGAPWGALALEAVALAGLVALSLGRLRPWSDVAAWGATLGVLALAYEPSPSLPLALGQGALLALFAASLHVAPEGVPRPDGVPALLLLACLAVGVAALAWGPALLAPRLAAQDGLSPVGAALRVLGAVALGGAGLALAVWVKRRRLARGAGAPGPDAGTASR